MKTVRTTLLWAFLAIALTSSVAWEMYELPDASARLASLPLRGAHFHGIEIASTEAEKQLFRGCNVLKRAYVIGSKQVFVSIVDGTRNRNAVHDPSVCFTGGGWEIVGSRNVATSQGNIAVLSLRKETVEREAAVWFSEGDRVYGSAVTYWMRSAIRRLTFGRSGAEPIRIVVQPQEHGQAIQWQQLLEQFPQLLRV